MAVNLNKIANDVFNIINKTFEEQVIVINHILDVKSTYIPGSGDDPELDSFQYPVRAIRKTISVERTRLPEYETNAVDILILQQDLPAATMVKTGDVLETDDGVYVILRIDADAANVTHNLMCKKS